MKYSLDTSAITGAWRKHYPQDIFPSLWRQHLPDLISSGELRAIYEVRVELERQDDELLKWMLEREEVFVEIDDHIQLQVQEILRRHRTLIDARKGRSGADPFVIALARRENCAVLTEERASGSLKRPHIPDVCQALGVPCLDLLQLMRKEGWSFT